MFRRRRSREADDDVDLDELAHDDATDEGLTERAGDAADEDGSEPEEPRFDRSNGPWDADEVDPRQAAAAPAHDPYALDLGTAPVAEEPADLAEDGEAHPATGGGERLDLGALRVRGAEGMQVRLEVNEGTRDVRAVTIGDNESAVQLEVFAAPRSSGTWPELRRQLRSEVARRGGTATEGTGRFGTELRVVVPISLPDGRSGVQTSRVVGVEGPRWTLRASFFGRAADPAQAARAEQVLCDVIVVRGAAPMAPGDRLALTIPGAIAAPAGRTPDPLSPFARGPEITETR